MQNAMAPKAGLAEDGGTTGEGNIVNSIRKHDAGGRRVERGRREIGWWKMGELDNENSTDVLIPGVFDADLSVESPSADVRHSCHDSRNSPRLVRADGGNDLDGKKEIKAWPKPYLHGLGVGTAAVNRERREL